MSEHPDTTGWAEIRVETPLPMEVAATLMQLIGTAWPDAQIKTDGGGFSFGGRALTMLVDHRRRPKKVTKKAAAAMVGESNSMADEAAAAGVGDSEFLGFDDGWVSVSAPKELQLHLSNVCAHLLDSNEDAVNYLEWEVREPAQENGMPGRAFVISAARGKGQTPHALRTRAEKELADLRAELRALADDFKTRAEDASVRELADSNAYARRVVWEAAERKVRDLAGPEEGQPIRSSAGIRSRREPTSSASAREPATRPIPPEVTHCANCGAKVLADRPHEVGECVYPLEGKRAR